MSLFVPFARSQQSSPAPPLSEEELQLILGQLEELGVLRKLVTDYDSRLKREQEMRTEETQLHQREADIARKALDIAERETKVAQGERDLAQQQAAFYRQAYETATRKPSLKCRIWRVLTLGTHACY